MIVTEILELAIEAELGEKSFYKEACDKSGTSLGKALFARLIKEEDFHAAKAREISEFLERGMANAARLIDGLTEAI